MDRAKLKAIAGAAAALAVILAIYLLVQRQSDASPSVKAPASEEEKAYLSKIVVTEARMSAAENFAGGTVTYLDARLSNLGARPVRRVEIQLEFHDTLRQVVLRETAGPVTSRSAPLEPNASRAFRVTFEHMPAEWDQAPPTITPTAVHF